MNVALNAAEFKPSAESVLEVKNRVAALVPDKTEDGNKKNPTATAVLETDDEEVVGAEFIPTQEAEIDEPYMSGLPETESMRPVEKDKIDYMIHLLESQRDLRTGSTTEDLILYGFLGVFIIFVLDSFNRSAKYRR